MKNDGKKSEKIFDAWVKSHGKSAFLYQFYDAAYLNGLNSKSFKRGNITLVPEQPSDRLVILEGQTFFAEVKSTISKTSFGFSGFQKKQIAYGTKAIRAGGDYRVFIHSLLLDEWYMVPFELILASEKKSLKWEQLKEYYHEGLNEFNRTCR